MTMTGKEYDKDGNEQEGGGYMMKGGKLCKMEKSLTGEDLEKSLDMLGDFAGEETENRKATLLQKAMETDLDSDEQAELFGLMGGGEASPETHSEKVVKSLNENEPLQKALDVSDYLREQHEELCKSLGTLAEFQEQADSRQNEFNILLAKAISNTGSMVKAMSERLGVIAAQPARGPKSAGVQGGQPLQKSFGGEAPEGETMIKSQVLDLLDAMHIESMEKGRDGKAGNGESINMAIAKYESTNTLSKSMLDEVKAYRSRQASAH